MSDSSTNTNPVMMDDPEAGSTWFLSLVSIVLMVVTVLALASMFFGFEASEVERKVVDKPVVELQELKLSQQETLTESGTYEIENADGESEKRYRIPVSNAMNLIIAEEKSRSSSEEISEGSVATR
ncbi:MAG: hypothetical protein CMJ23_02195 [Phycisphaerae bacterium]|nr:hypothetical protein [Phycisphaerae bacterium]